jgi:hypothetical protein
MIYEMHVYNSISAVIHVFFYRFVLDDIFLEYAARYYSCRDLKE